MKKGRWSKIMPVFFGSVVVLLIGFQISWAKYPDKTINFIHAWGAGGSNDIPLRPLAAAASEILGQPIVVEYHPGGSGAIGMGMLKNRKPDGYTIGMTSTSSLIGQQLVKFTCKIPDDFTTIMQYCEGPNGLAVRGDSPWKTFQEFIDYVKANPGKIRFSSGGPGHPAAIGMAMLAKKLQLKYTHIPFEGGPQATVAVLGGHVEAYACTTTARPQMLAGQLRLLVVFGENRLQSFPNVPTAKELGFPVVVPSAQMLFAPKGLPSDILETLHQAFKKAMANEGFIKGAAAVEYAVIYKNPQETVQAILKFNEEFKEIAQDLKIQKK